MYFDSDIGDGEHPGQEACAAHRPRARRRALSRDLGQGLRCRPTGTSRSTRSGRPVAQHLYYQHSIDLLVGRWPDEDRRWRDLRDYYFNAIRDCDQQGEPPDARARIQRHGEEHRSSIFTADHGELGGSHQMRGKGTNAYRQQNHLPLMIIHPAIRGRQRMQGRSPRSSTSRPPSSALTGKDARLASRARAKAARQDFSALLRTPEAADQQTVRPAALFNFDMLSYAGPEMGRADDRHARLPREVAAGAGEAPQPGHLADFPNRTGDAQHLGRPLSLLALLLADAVQHAEDAGRAARQERPRSSTTSQADPDEMNNLALDPKKNGDLIVALNQVMNERIADEVGVDDGRSCRSGTGSGSSRIDEPSDVSSGHGVRDVRGVAVWGRLSRTCPVIARLCQRVEVELEAHDRRRRIGRDRQRRFLHREHREHIAVRPMALRRARSAVARRAEVGARLQGALRAAGRPSGCRRRAPVRSCRPEC